VKPTAQVTVQDGAKVADVLPIVVDQEATISRGHPYGTVFSVGNTSDQGPERGWGKAF
jgi:hypothetical protein